MSPRLQGYLSDSNSIPDITIRAEQYDAARWPDLNSDSLAYMESGYAFYYWLLKFDGMMLHSSAIELDGSAYLFSGPSGVGKSTHTGLWQRMFPQARLFNDDKPALREKDGVWYAYGTPWCGKNGININMKAPIKGICFLRQGPENKIRRLYGIEAAREIISQTNWRFNKAETLDIVMRIVENVVKSVPIWMMECLPNEDSVMLSYNTMKGE